MTGPWLRIQAAMPKDPRIRRTGFWGITALQAILQLAKLLGWDGGRIPLEDLDADTLADHLNVHESNGEISGESIRAGLAAGIDALMREDVLVPDKPGADGAVTHLTIRKWSKYQRDATNAERQKRHRDKRNAK